MPHLRCNVLGYSFGTNCVFLCPINRTRCSNELGYFTKVSIRHMINVIIQINEKASNDKTLHQFRADRYYFLFVVLIKSAPA